MCGSVVKLSFASTLPLIWLGGFDLIAYGRAVTVLYVCFFINCKYPLWIGIEWDMENVMLYSIYWFMQIAGTRLARTQWNKQIEEHPS